MDSAAVAPIGGRKVITVVVGIGWGGGFGTLGAAPNQADEERAEGREAGGDHGYRGFGRGPEHGRDEVGYGAWNVRSDTGW